MEVKESYSQVIGALFKKKPKKREGIGKIVDVLEELDNPQKKYPTIHIAGTNGKGQVAVKIASALEEAGYYVGLFLSPHLIEYEERITINGEKISKEKVVEYYLKLERFLNKRGIDFHFFEYSTCFAFQYFSEQKVDVAVIETGLGGMFDATNVIRPDLAVITSISFDHTEYLGDTLEAIAKQKGGIIKEKIPVVLGPQANYSSIHEQAKKMSAPLYLIEEAFPFYLLENCAITRKGLEILSKTFSINEQAIEKGLKKTLPCRFDKRGDYLFDVAHNPEGFAQLSKGLKLYYPSKNFRFVIGLGSQKDLRGCLSQIADIAAHIHFVQAVEQGVCLDTLAKALKQLSDCPYTLESSISNGIVHAKEKMREDELIVVCGSFYIMAEALRASGLKI